ncbi:unnamed protein product [Zymoseptoria tritici ST99CH_1A5]|uniref:RRM domain-containing protein n=3 Tax=Zymoseptoria tritici TaxID=1047171 RepID=A0A1X7RQS8_ZYMT9|nr:unnamed protein product [Zymoseptoria tritici ST99CH_3D7]SMR50592.1 unnamed protein product [Zymoseptoria tritici ST99CH_1E4]SMR51535.1 unnamed protein product [Zymoseptoria tritici ST99CH_3D1]SMY23292.1 unnamed protein product [Zymoseptoria tritici ST99CH_1A5]
MADLDTYDADQRNYEDDRDREYPARDRSRSPVADRDGEDTRVRDRDNDEPMNGRDDGRDERSERPPPNRRRNDDDDISTNPGSNLFVTGIHPKLSEEEVTRIFEKYGQVEKCNIMRDPHTRDSRGFGFVKMVTSDEADAAKEALQGEVYEGRTFSIEKARRARPRTPTPGKYFGPPKREDGRPPGREFGGRGGDRYERGGYGGRRDDNYRRGGGGGYRDRYDDRGGYGGRRDDYGAPRVDRYASGGREGDRYGGGDRDRRGGGGGGGYGGGYDRASRGPPADVAGGYPDAAAPRDAPREAPPARGYDDRRRAYD